MTSQRKILIVLIMVVALARAQVISTIPGSTIMGVYGSSPGWPQPMTSLPFTVPSTQITGLGGSCSGSTVMTSLNSSAVPTCTALSSSYLPSGVSPTLYAATVAIGGSLLLLGGCATATVTITGVTSTWAINVTPQSDPGGGVDWKGIPSANSVLVKMCAEVASITPASTIFLGETNDRTRPY